MVDRATGQFLYQSEPFVRQINLFAPASPAGVLVARVMPGGVSVSPTSYDPEHGYLYVAAIDRAERAGAVPIPAAAGQTRVELHPVHRGAVVGGVGVGHADCTGHPQRRQDRVAGQNAGAARSVACSPPPAGWSSSARPTGISMRLTRPVERRCGAFRRAPTWARRSSPTRSTGGSLSPSPTALPHRKTASRIAPGALRPGGAVFAFAVLR